MNAIQETQDGVVNPILTGFVIDERFARNDVTGRAYFLRDALGSTLALTDTSGAILQRYNYDPYGHTIASNTTAGFTNPYQFTGREADDIGLDYYRARYYSPMLGRFISEDPVGFWGGQYNFYAYAAGNPVQYSDPAGYSAGVAAADFLAGSGEVELTANPAGLVVAAGVGGYALGTIINNAYGQDIGDFIWDVTHPVQMAAPGNQVDSGIAQKVQELQSSAVLSGKQRPGRCKVLQQLIDEGVISPQAAKATQKAWGCRHSRMSKDRCP